MRSITEIDRALCGKDMQGNPVEYPTDEEILFANNFYKELHQKMLQCPQLAGVACVAYLSWNRYEDILYARHLKQIKSKPFVLVRDQPAY